MKTKLLLTAATLFTSVLLKTVTAQNGTNDAGYTVGSGFDGGVYTAGIQPSDDKTIVSGWFSSYNGAEANQLVRLNTDGTIDGTFSSGTGIAGSGARVIAFQPNDEKIMLGGYFSSYNGTAVNSICRINADGTLDGAFQVTECNDQVTAIAVQADGKVIVGGWFTSINNTAINCIVRLNTNGTIDNTFNVGTGADLYVSAIAIQNDGKIIIGGNFTTYNGTNINRLARLNTDGTLDGTFNVGNGADAFISDIRIQPDGKIVIAGTFYSYNGSSNYRVTRINTDGSPDNTFSDVGSGIDGEVYSIALQSDGKIVVGGYFQNYNNQPVGRVVRLHANGNIDYNFDVTGADATVNYVGVQYNNKIIVSGEFTTYDGQNRNSITQLSNCIFNTINVMGNTTICPYTSADLSVTSDGGTQSWYDAEINGNYLAPGSGFATPLLTETTTYYVQDSLACGVSMTPVTVTVQSVDVSVNQQGTTLSAGNPNIEATYQWYNCTTQQPIANETNSSFTATENGSYALIVTQLLCTDTSACFSVTGIGIDTYELNGTFLVSPNPASSIITLRYSLLADADLTINAYDVSGRLIQNIVNNKAIVAGDLNTETISVSEYPSGFYFIGINASNGEQIMHKLMVAR